jgi:hypothetical protein
MSKIFKKIKSFRLPDNDKIGLGFIKGSIKIISTNKLIGIKGMLEQYPDSDEKKEIIESLKEEFKKRKLDYDSI